MDTRTVTIMTLITMTNLTRSTIIQRPMSQTTRIRLVTLRLENIIMDMHTRDPRARRAKGITMSMYWGS